MALSKLHLCALVWEARTDFGSVGAGRRAILTQIDNFRQGLAHPRLDPTCNVFNPLPPGAPGPAGNSAISIASASRARSFAQAP